jgi:hypothetical protein
MEKILVKIIFIFSLLILFIQPSVANEIKQANIVKMFESCADNSFKNQFGQKNNDYLMKPLKVKISNSTPYEWFFEDCEIEHKNNPIKFKVKNSIYKEDVNEITRKVFETCGDQRYVLEHGDIYNEFLAKPIIVKMQEIEYDWSVEFCENEYNNYPIKFILKYSS